jgi:hypothetical protein
MKGVLLCGISKAVANRRGGRRRAQVQAESGYHHDRDPAVWSVSTGSTGGELRNYVDVNPARSLEVIIYEGI